MRKQKWQTMKAKHAKTKCKKMVAKAEKKLDSSTKAVEKLFDDCAIVAYESFAEVTDPSHARRLHVIIEGIPAERNARRKTYTPAEQKKVALLDKCKAQYATRTDHLKQARTLLYTSVTCAKALVDRQKQQVQQELQDLQESMQPRLEELRNLPPTADIKGAKKRSRQIRRVTNDFESSTERYQARIATLNKSKAKFEKLLSTATIAAANS